MEVFSTIKLKCLSASPTRTLWGLTMPPSFTYTHPLASCFGQKFLRASLPTQLKTIIAWPRKKCLVHKTKIHVIYIPH